MLVSGLSMDTPLDETSSGAPVSGEFVIDLREDTERFDRGEMELLLTWIEWVEVEVRGFPDLMEELNRLRGAVMVAALAAVG
jgi:hypothetical protein